MWGRAGWGLSARRLGDRRLGRRQAARLPAPVPVAFPVLASNAAPCWAVRSTGWETRRATATAHLETFENRHAGTSFRAANRAGETAGRGRQGRNGDTEGCYELDVDWRERIPEPRLLLAPLETGAGELGGTGVRRCASGGCAPGDLRPAPGGSAGVHGRREGGARPTTVSSTSRGGDGGEHSATAPDAASRGRRRCCACRTAVR